MLVTHSFLISDKFARAKTTSNPNKQNNNNNVEVPMVDISNINNRHSSKIGSSSSLQVNNFPHFYDQNSLAYDAVSSSGKNTATADGGATAVEGEKAAFDPESVEVCLNLTGLIVGVAAFLVVQLGLVFGWTHFWQSRQKKMARYG
jgi:hypothetical protein